MARIARALEAEDAAGGLFDVAAALGARQSLAEIGLREEDLDRAADLAQVRKSVRRIKVAMASAFPYQAEYHLAYLYLKRAAF
jgi:hypothetical protein